MEIILILCGDLWHFTPFFGCCLSVILDWVTTFHFARLVHMQCKHHFSSYIVTLHNDNTKLLPRESF
ncbi:hypothetical protein, partial [Thiolapillus sp.]|uniref:hypothetical protein n=1 Tax=Thiolapillus sp. TaxID=2017437 RepID=UPI003AF5AC92